MNIRVVVTHANGTIAVYELDSDQLRLLAKGGIEYQLIDMNTNIGPKVVYLTRSGDDLEVRFEKDEEDADILIEQHFEFADSSVLVGEADNGEIHFYTPNTDSGNHDTAMEYTLPDTYTMPSDISTEIEVANETASTSALPAFNNNQWVALGGVIVLGGVALVAGGGGGGGASVANIVSGNVSAGPLVDSHRLTLNLYDENGNLLAENVEILGNGDFSVDIGDYTGPILARINLDSDMIADYHDEGTGQGKDLDTQLQAIGYADGNGLTLNVNPVTHLAARQLLGEHSDLAEINVSEQDINQVNEQTGELLGIDGDVTQLDPQLALDEQGQPTASSDQYGRVLAAIAGAEADQGITTEEVISSLLTGLDEEDPTRFKADDDGDTAKQLLSDGASKASDAGSLTEDEATRTIENIVVDTEAPPTVTTTAGDQLINAEDFVNGDISVLIRFKFNRPPAEGEFTLDDIWVNGEPNGDTISDLRVDENDATVYWANFTPANDGEFNIGVPAGSYTTTDGVENIAGLDVNITRDTDSPAAPNISLADGQDNIFGSQDDMIELVVSTSGLQLGDQIQLYLGEDSFGGTQVVTQANLDESSVSFIWPIDVLGGDGHKVVTGRVTDRAGNESEVSAELTFTLDTTISTEALQLSLAEGQGEYINADEESVAMVITLGENAMVDDDIQLKINEGDYSTYYALTAADISAGEVTIQVPIEHLGDDGDKTILARLTDEAGNLGPDSEALSLMVDTQVPQLLGDSPISIIGTSDGETLKEGTLIQGDVIRIEVAMSETVEVTGEPRFAIQLGDQIVFADYHGEFSSDSRLVFTYTIMEDDMDVLGGITAQADALILGDASITDQAGNPADVSSAAILSDSNTVRVDAVAPLFVDSDRETINVQVGEEFIVDINATDTAGVNDEGIQYRLAETGDYELFNIDSNTGELTLREASSTVAEYQLTIIATDEVGNHAEQSLTVNILDAPTVTITDNIDGQVTNSNTIVFTFTFSEPVTNFGAENININDLVGVTYGSPVPVGSDGTTYTVTVTLGEITREGTITLSVADGADVGLSSNRELVGASHSQDFDLIPPDAPTIALAFNSGDDQLDGVTNNGALTVDAEAGATVDYYVTRDDGEEMAAMTAQEYQTYIDEREAMNDDGNYRVRVVATDAAGNTSESRSITFALDTTVPAGVITSFGLATDSGADDSDGITRFAGVSITTDSSNDNSPGGGLTTEYRIINRNDVDDPDDDTVAFDWQASAISNDLIPDGDYRYEARVKDEAGNVGQVHSFEFTLDTDPPTAPVVSLLENTGPSDEDTIITSNGYLTVTYDIDDVVEVRYFVTQGEGEEQEAMSAAQYQGFIDALVNNGDDGLITVRVELEDTAGNTSDSTITFTLDVTAPSFEDGGPVNTPIMVGHEGSVWTPSIYDDNSVVFSISDESVDGALFRIDPTTGVVTFINPPPGAGNFRLIIIATDAAGNQAEQNVTVNVVDTLTVMISDNIVEDVTNAETVEFTFTFSEPVSDFSFDDISISGGSADANNFAGSGTSYRLIVNTASGINDGELQVTVNANSVTGDYSGTAIASTRHSQRYDTAAPTETPNAAIVDNGLFSDDAITNAETVVSPTTNAGTTTEYRLLDVFGGVVYDWQETYEAPEVTDFYTLEVRQLDGAGNSSPIQILDLDFVAGVFDDVESLTTEIDEINNVISISFSDLIDNSNTIDPNQFTVVVDGQDVGITQLSVSDELGEGKILKITVDSDLAGSQSAIVTYIAGDSHESRVINQFGESYEPGQGTTYVSYNIEASPIVFDHADLGVDTNLIFSVNDTMGTALAVTVTGSRFDDFIQLADGNDVVYAGAGDDHIHASSGSNTFTGGLGRDTFTYIDSDDTGDDVITDFELGELGDIVELACLADTHTLQDTVIFSVDEQENEILLQIFAGRDATSGGTATQTITLQSTDDLSAVTLQSLLDSGQLVIG